jgi:ketosteroid isomerase-like protein
MSVEIIDRLFDAVHRRDLPTYLACFTADAEYRAGNLPAVYGHQGIEEFSAQVIPNFDKVLHNVKAVWQAGNTCVCELDVVYHRLDGQVVNVPCLDIIRVEDGKVKSLRAYLDASPAFA